MEAPEAIIESSLKSEKISIVQHRNKIIGT